LFSIRVSFFFNLYFFTFFFPRNKFVPILKKLIGAFQKKYCSECKGKLQTVVASYTTDAVFKIPDGLDLEDKTVVQDWRTKYGKLYITYVNSDEVLTIDRDRVGYSD